MALSPTARHRARYLVPLGAAAITAAVVVIPQAASGAAHPNLPARTAAQLLASLEQAHVPQFSGTVVETARLGLPSIGDSSLVQAAGPASQSGLMQVVTLLTGSHTAQIAYGGAEKQRVAIFLSDLSEMDIVHNGSDLWTYSSSSNSVTHNKLESKHSDTQTPEQDVTTPMNPDKVAEQALRRIDPSTKVVVDRTAEVANRAAYQLDLTPRNTNTLVGSVRIALDSKTSLPLRVQIWSRNNTSSPAFEVGFTSISMSSPSDSTFDFTTPPSAYVDTQPLSHFFSGPLGESGAPKGAVPQQTVPRNAVPQKSSGKTSTAVLGNNWTSVFVAHLNDSGSADASTLVPPPAVVRTAPGLVRKSTVVPGTRRPQPPSLTDELGQLGTRVAAGHIITTSLITILVTNDNRVLIGAVTPSYLERVAASKAAQ